MAELRRWTDRWGRPVVLFEDTWFDKITVRHPNLENYLDGVGLAIMYPDRVNFDADYPEGENFYGQRILGAPYQYHFLKVCVRYRDSIEGQIGVVISAFPSPSIKREERAKWTR